VANQAPAQTPEYLTLPEVAEHYRTTEATVRYWRHNGYGPKGVRLGTRVLYPRAEVERFDRHLADQAVTGTRTHA
jgi:Helix-turn-helix domain